MPKLSIIIPFYGVENYIEKCLESVKNQTYLDFEVILVNDGSKDNSEKIVDRFVKEDKRFKCYKKKNGGLSDARNYGMKYAKGEYITFLDSDDYIDLDLYEKMMERAIATKADIVEADFIWQYDHKQVYDYSRVNDLERLMIDIRVVAWNKLYKKELLDKLGVSFSIGLRYEDVDWCYKIIPYVKRFESIRGTYIHYVQRSTSIANTQNGKVRDIYSILTNVINYYKGKNLFNQYKEQLEYIFLRYIFGSSFLRTICVPDKKLRNEILDEGYKLLKDTFPNFKKNIYLKKEKGMKNFYFKTVNRFTYKIYAKLFRLRKGLL